MANLQNLTPWGPNNPPPKSPGRPRKRPQSEANEDLVRMEIPEAWRKAMNRVTIDGRPCNFDILKPGATFADAIAYGLGKRAMSGDPTAAKELRESIEGKSVQRVELTHPEDRGFEVKVTFEMPATPRIIEPAIQEAIDVAAVQPALEEKPEEE